MTPNTWSATYGFAGFDNAWQHMQFTGRKKEYIFTRPAFRTTKFCSVLTRSRAIRTSLKTFSRDRANFLERKNLLNRGKAREPLALKDQIKFRSSIY
jgi:hypothetical protein